MTTDATKQITVLQAMFPPTCRRCASPLIRRARRRFPFERLLALVHVYPYRCQQCLKRFYASS